jgi:hypothetical protein
MRDIPTHLINEILQGSCVAFVGAGFSAPAVPNWDDLLNGIAADCKVSDEAEVQVKELLKPDNRMSSRGTFDREAAAQILQDDLGKEDFGSLLERVITEGTTKKGLKSVENRIRLLLQIPFQSILTTNFDNLLQGQIGSDDVYRDILRKKREPWFNIFSWDKQDIRRADIVKLHGQIRKEGQSDRSDVVLTRTEYRELLFEGSRYSNFLRSILATRTILFLGFSFSDAYLNLLRSEILAMLKHDPTKNPLAYAVLDDVGDEESNFLLTHEGIQVLGYDIESDGYSGFDEYLKAIHAKTAPARILGDLLNGKRLLWLDPKPDNNLYGKKVIDETADMGCEIVELSDPSVALDHLKDGSFDLVISHWGGLAKDASGKLRPTAVQLLDGIRKRDIEVPVIIFASPKHGQDNRSKALSLGAFEYTWYFEDLFEAIQRLFKEPKL